MTLMKNGESWQLVELVGPAGAGKSTLCRALTQQSLAIREANFPDVRKISSAPFYIWNGLPLLTTVTRSYRSGDNRSMSRREFAWLAILRGWPNILQKELKKNSVIVLDQGPVSLLTELFEFGPPFLKDQAVKSMWQEIYGRWIKILDMIIWLDAENIDLLSRIRKRDKGHVVKNESDENVLSFLNRNRKAYKEIISRMSCNSNNLKILQFDTSQKSTKEIVNQLFLQFGF